MLQSSITSSSTDFSFLALDHPTKTVIVGRNKTNGNQFSSLDWHLSIVKIVNEETNHLGDLVSADTLPDGSTVLYLDHELKAIAPRLHVAIIEFATKFDLQSFSG